MIPASRSAVPYRRWAPALLLLGGCAAPPAATSHAAASADPSPASASAAVAATPGAAVDAQVLQGRLLVIDHDCGACHGGFANPAAADWLVGNTNADDPTAKLGPFSVWASNLTPDAETGLGRFSERQIFNALRYGLRPAGTPDVEITSAVPGEGNHPANPDYLAPAMPWLFWRFMTDAELRAVAAYLKRGLRPVRSEVPASQAPPDRWASEFTVEKVGTHVLPPFPTANEAEPPADRREQVLRGRALTAQFACSACHGGAVSPAAEGCVTRACRTAAGDTTAGPPVWLAGMTSEQQAFQIGPFKTRPRNLTPHNTTGMGRFTERQIFNALRYGLRPGETPDVEITSTTPGEGNFPLHPKYLAPPMPWPAWRHIPDEDLRAIAAYLKHGVRPVENRVADSEGPPDFWASEYTPEKYGTYPAPPFPTAREQAMVAGH